MKDILTEAEAKTRWCPMVRGHMEIDQKAATAFNAGINQSGEDVRIGKCVAGECMAWRLSHKDGPNGEETGYCGAFGIPRFT